MTRTFRRIATCSLCLGLVVAPAVMPAAADDVTPVPVSVPSGSSSSDIEKEIEELQRRIGILTEEVRKMKERETIPETVELKSTYGMAPAASKVYGKERGLSIGGYGEFNFKKEVGDKKGNDDVFDFVRFVGYLGYKFNDWIVMNSEIEVEHASTDKNGSVSLEFAYLDFMLHRRMGVRAGLLLVPVGFINELHEPTVYHGNQRPAVERQLIPSTWRANGAGIYGELAEGLTYRTYAITSMRAANFSSSNLRGGRQKGSEERAEDWSWVGRLDWTPLEGLDFGGSVYVGNQGQDETIVKERDAADVPIDEGTVAAFMQMYEGHAQWRWRGWEARALGVWVDLDDTRALSTNALAPIANTMNGWYAELAYNLLPLLRPETEQYLAPWFRYSQYDTQADVASGLVKDNSQDRDSWEIGLDYKPIPQVVLKVDYRNEDASSGDRPDVVRVGGGFVF